jgi:hypothetical protein
LRTSGIASFLQRQPDEIHLVNGNARPFECLEAAARRQHDQRQITGTVAARLLPCALEGGLRLGGLSIETFFPADEAQIA